MHNWVAEERPPPGTRLIDHYRNLRERSRVPAYLVVVAIVFVVIGTIGLLMHLNGDRYASYGLAYPA